MPIYAKNSLFLVVLLLISRLVFSQSYDVSDSVPPTSHSLRTYDISPVCIFFKEKYRLLVDVDCQSKRLIIDVRLKGGSIANNIKVVDDSIINISLLPSAYSKMQPISGNIIIRPSFLIRVNLDSDTAVFHADYYYNYIQVSLVEENWFIESEPLLNLPSNIFWIISEDFKAIKNIKSVLKKENLARYIKLEGGYYRCFPTKFIWRKHNKNECSLGPVFFFESKSESDICKSEAVIKNLMPKGILFGTEVQFSDQSDAD